jgi:hypothetical protein
VKQAPHYDWDMTFGNTEGVTLSPLQAIRHHCWSCVGGHESPWPMSDGTVEPPVRPFDEVRACTDHSCFLYPFRTGRNPNRKGLGATKNLSQKTHSTRKRGV